MPTSQDLKDLAEVREDHKRSLAATTKEHLQIRKNYAAYHGEPGGVIPKADLAKMEEEGRPILNLNKIKPVVNMILGLELNNPLVMRVFAEQSENTMMAAALDAIGNHEWYRTRGNDKRAECFGMGVIAKRGHVVVGLKTDQFIPTIELRAIDGLQLHIDPGSTEYNPDDDADYGIIESWFTKDALQAMHPDDARDIEELLKEGEGEGRAEDLPFPQEPHKKLEWVADYSVDPVMRIDHHNGRLQALEHFKRKTKSVYRIWDPGTHFYEDFDTQKERNEALQAAHQQYPLLAARLVPMKLQTREMIRKVVLGGRILVEKGQSPYPDELGFPWATFRAHHYGKKTTSVVDDLIDPARQHMITWANMIHIMQSVAHAGWLNPEQSGLTTEQLEETGSKTGGVLTYNYPFKPQKIEPSTMPLQHLTDLGYTDEQIKEISGANEALRGISPGSIESGRGVDLLQRQGIAVLAILYSNLQRMEYQLYRKMLIMIQNFMPIPEEIEIMGRKLAGRLMELAPDEALIDSGGQRFLKLGILGGMNTLKTLKYKVRLDYGPATRHQREYWAQVAMQLAAQLPPNYFPPEVIVELTDFPFADEIIQHISNMRELEAAQVAMAAGTEIAAGARE